MSTSDGSRGVTLFELLIVLMIMSVMAGVGGLAVHTAEAVSIADPMSVCLVAAEDSAARSGRRVTMTLLSRAGMVRATVYPDGRVVADSTIAVDAMTG